MAHPMPTHAQAYLYFPIYFVTVVPWLLLSLFTHEMKCDHEHGVGKPTIKENALGLLRSCNSPTVTMCSQPLELMVDLPGLNIPEMYATVIPLPNTHTPVNRFRFHVLQP